MPVDFFTGSQLLTLAGATLATIVIVNAVRHAWGWSPRWFALVVALLVSVAAWFLWSPHTPEAFALAVLNTFVIYTAATGGNQISSELFTKPVGLRSYGERGFFDPWWGWRN